MTTETTEKIWYLDFDGEVEGPFSHEELKKDQRISPDTFIWREGFADWVLVKSVPELQDIFKDEHSVDQGPREEKDEEAKKKRLLAAREEMALNLEEGGPPYYVYWLLIIAILLCYLWFWLQIK